LLAINVVRRHIPKIFQIWRSKTPPATPHGAPPVTLKRVEARNSGLSVAQSYGASWGAAALLIAY
jgi:hypothetical protein